MDPIVGIKGRVDIDPSWYVTGWGMVGGFGAASDVTWDVFGGVGYQWNERLSLVAGYRALGVDYEDDGFVYVLFRLKCEKSVPPELRALRSLEPQLPNEWRVWAL